MKNIRQFLFLFSIIIPLFITGEITAQRNPVLEFCTGTWCPWCPCGHHIIENTILPNIPNTVLIAYHGSDVFSTYPGSSIRASLGLTSYPTGLPDRTAGPLSRSTWYSHLNSRKNVPPTVDISIYKTFDSANGQLTATFTVTPLVDLTGNYYINVILLENRLVASQECYSDCCGSDMTIPDYVHDHVVRNMLNGATGTLLNTTSPWPTGIPQSTNISYKVPTDNVYANCDIVTFVYKENSPLNRGEIQQAMKWTLEGDITPVELNSFAFNNDATGVNLLWSTATETNNSGFQIERKIPLNPPLVKGDAALAEGDWEKIGFVNGAGTTTETQNYFFRDEKPSASSKTIYYRLKQIDYDGTFDYSKILTVEFDTPQKYELSQNYPNPFNPFTVISYSIMQTGQVKLMVYDIMGKQVAALVDEVKEIGSYEVSFDASQLASGTYFYSMITPGFTSTKKMIVIK
ncbi:MAG: Omp28-related outer membrane protein [bacterium]